MKILILAPGSRGDVQPYVALGKGLKNSGHTVRILASRDFRSLITDHGLEFVDMGADVESVARGMQLEKGNVLKMLSDMGNAARRLAHQAAVAGLDAGRDSDLILGGLGGLFVGAALSDTLGIPFIQAHLLPLHPTREFPGALAPLPPMGLPGWANALTHRMTRQMMWQAFRMADNHVRKDVLHIPSAPFGGPFAALEKAGLPILYGYSPNVLPHPRDWAQTIHVTGYWFLDPPAGYRLPGEVMDFLEAGPPPVYIGFGSMPHSRPEDAADMVVRALERTGQRGVVYAGWGGLAKREFPRTILMVESLPHRRLFPRMAAVVHHGGAGTTGASLSAGVPTVVTPFFGDQPFWGCRVYDLGVGPKPVLRRRLTLDSLSRAILAAVTDDEMKKRAASLGRRIQAEDGVARAMEILEKVRR